MDQSQEKVNSMQYELGYHLLSDLEEPQITSAVKNVEKIIADNGGSIISVSEPKRIHLSYPIKHKHYAYFGIINFSTPPESIKAINKQFKLQNEIIRYIIIKNEQAKALRTLGDIRKSDHKPPATYTPAKDKEEGAQITPEQEEKMKKEIEDVLKNI